MCVYGGKGHGASGCDFMEVILPYNFISIKEIPDFYLIYLLGSHMIFPLSIFASINVGKKKHCEISDLNPSPTIYQFCELKQVLEVFQAFLLSFIEWG